MDGIAHNQLSKQQTLAHPVPRVHRIFTFPIHPKQVVADGVPHSDLPMLLYQMPPPPPTHTHTVYMGLHHTLENSNSVTNWLWDWCIGMKLNPDYFRIGTKDGLGSE